MVLPLSGEAQGRFLSWGTTNVLIQRTTTKDVQESEGVERLSKICPMWSFEGSACAKSRGFFLDLGQFGSRAYRHPIHVHLAHRWIIPREFVSCRTHWSR